MPRHSPTTTAPARPAGRRRVAAFIAVGFAVLATIAASIGVASASSAIEQLDEIAAAGDDMGSGAVEWSGATWNADRNVLLTVDDEGMAYEFALDDDGLIDDTIEPRLIRLLLGHGDLEGVVWMGGERYGFLSEGTGTAIFATVPAAEPDGTTTVRAADIDSTFDAAPFEYPHNLGPDGIATDGEAFYVTIEKPSQLNKFAADGTWVASVALPDLLDTTGVAVVEDGTFLVTSHESAALAHYAIDWTEESAQLLATVDAAGFTQLEGVAAVGNTDVHLFGEDNTRKGNPGQTYSHLRREIVAPAVTWAVGDVNCSGSVTIGDALLITKMQVGTATPDPNCGDPDVDGDGQVRLRDAMLIAQCQVGITNQVCPTV